MALGLRDIVGIMDLAAMATVEEAKQGPGPERMLSR